MDLLSVPLKVQIFSYLFVLFAFFFFLWGVLSKPSVKCTHFANDREILGLIGCHNAWFKSYKHGASQLSNPETIKKC